MLCMYVCMYVWHVWFVWYVWYVWYGKRWFGLVWSKVWFGMACMYDNQYEHIHTHVDLLYNIY